MLRFQLCICRSCTYPLKMCRSAQLLYSLFGNISTLTATSQTEAQAGIILSTRSLAVRGVTLLLFPTWKRPGPGEIFEKTSTGRGKVSQRAGVFNRTNKHLKDVLTGQNTSCGHARSGNLSGSKQVGMVLYKPNAPFSSAFCGAAELQTTTFPCVAHDEWHIPDYELLIGVISNSHWTVSQNMLAPRSRGLKQPSQSRGNSGILYRR